MPPRLRFCSQCHSQLRLRKSPIPRYLSTASAITPAAPPPYLTDPSPPIARFPPTQPPSHKPPEYRKSQLHRQYTSLLRSTPLLLFFQHNNLKSAEWMAIRRELNQALAKVDVTLETNLAPHIKAQAIQGGIFASALMIADYYDPQDQPQETTTHFSDPPNQYSTANIANQIPSPGDPTFTHGLSRTAHRATKPHQRSHPLTPLLSGPLAVVSFPTVAPQHMKAVLSILAPQAPGFPAPTRRTSPGYHDAVVQAGLQKLLLLGARIEGKIFDQEGSRWVGGIEGGLEGLRGQLVAMLSGLGAGVTGVLEAAARSLWVTVEGRREMMEEESKSKGREGGGDN